jgi:hypothetical protein
LVHLRRYKTIIMILSGIGIIDSFSKSSPSISCFTSNGTWSCPIGTKKIVVVTIGGGGGGGGGGSSTSNLGYWGPGGAGGGGGGISCDVICTSIPDSVCVIVGTGGAGGCASSVYGNNGGNGVGGGISCFGSLVVANGGGGGQGGYISCTGPLQKTSTGGVGGTGSYGNGGTGGAGSACCNTNVCLNGNPGLQNTAAGGAGAGGGYVGGVGCGDPGSFGAGNTVFDLNLGRGGFGNRSCGNFDCSNGVLYGGGGGGAQTIGFTTGLCTFVGGNGAGGFVKIESYF